MPRNACSPHIPGFCSADHIAFRGTPAQNRTRPVPQFNLITVITASAQTVAALVMAILLLGFLRQYRKSYVRHWTLSWTAAAGYYIASTIGMGLGLSSNVSSRHPVRILTAALSGVLGYLSIAWLMFGIY